MGFITDALGITGSGNQNNFRATAPVNTFTARQANLDETSYRDAIKRALAANRSNVSGTTAADQVALARALQAQAAGEGPSLAQQQLQAGTQQNAVQAAGQLASARGINPALAARLIGQNVASANQTAAGQAAMARLQEQQTAQQLLASTLAAQRSGDISQQQADTALTTAVGGLQQGQNAARIQNLAQAQQLNQATAAQNAQLDLGAQQINAGVTSQNAQANQSTLGGLLGGAGAAIGLLSDERAKTKIRRHADEVVDGAPRATFEYKGQPGVRYEGVIAQDVEDEHPELVGEVDGIKFVDPLLAARPVTPEDDFTRALIKSRIQGYATGGSVPDYAQMFTQLFGGTPASVAPANVDPMVSGMTAVGAGLRKAFSGSPTTPGSPVVVNTGGAGFEIPLAANIGARDPYSLAALTGYADGGPVDFRGGGKVPGRALVAGDAPRNDIVDAKVSPGEIVLPRSVAQAPDAEEKAAQFVAAIKAKNKTPTSYGEVLAGQRSLEARLARLEQMAEGGEIQPLDIREIKYERTKGEIEPTEEEKRERAKKFAQSLDEGGEIEDDDSGILDRVAAWWKAKGASENANTSRAIADKIAATTPILSTARGAARQHNARLEAALQAAGGQ